MGKWFYAIVIAVMVGIVGFLLFPSIKTMMGEVRPTPVIVANYSFEISDPPASWTFVSGGGASTFSRSNTKVKIGNYSGKVIRNGTNCGFRQSYTTYAGKKISIGCWVWNDSVSNVAVAIFDGYTNKYSNFHQGTGWEYLTATSDIDNAATFANIVGLIYYNDTTAYFDDFVLYAGDLPETESSFLLEAMVAGLPYALVFFVGYAVYLGYKKTKGG